MRTSHVFLFALLFAVVGLTGCEFSDPLEGFELRFAVEDTDIDLGAGVTAQVRPGEATVQTETIDNSLSDDIKSIDTVTSIQLAPSMFAFIPSASGKSAAPSGVLNGYLTIGPVPVPGTPIRITITDGAVTAVSPSTLLGPDATLDLGAYERYLALIPANQRPSLDDFKSLSIDEIRERIAAALSGSSFPVSFGLTVESSNPNDPLTGAITISEIRFSGNVTAK